MQFSRAAERSGAAPVLSWGSRRCSEPEVISSAWRVSPDVLPAHGMGSGWEHPGKAAQRIAWPAQSYEGQAQPGVMWEEEGKGLPGPLPEPGIFCREIAAG